MSDASGRVDAIEAVADVEYKWNIKYIDQSIYRVKAAMRRSVGRSASCSTLLLLLLLILLRLRVRELIGFFARPVGLNCVSVTGGRGQ